MTGKRVVAWAIAVVVLGGTGGIGVYDGITEWKDAHSLLQRSVTGGVFLYGVFGLAAGVGLILKKRWSLTFAFLWAVVVTYVAGAAVLAYGDADASVGGAITASLGAALVAALIAWAARLATCPQVSVGDALPVGSSELMAHDGRPDR